MPKTMKTNEPLDPEAIGLFGLVSQVPASNQCPKLVHETGGVVWQLWRYVQNHKTSLHAVFIYSIVGAAAQNCTPKAGICDNCRKRSWVWCWVAPNQLKTIKYPRFVIVNRRTHDLRQSRQLTPIFRSATVRYQ